MTEQIIVSSTGIIGVTIIALIGLKGWQGWLSLKERELDRPEASVVHAQPHHDLDGGSHVGAARIEIADLKERLRKLEAIASGVDL